MSLDLQFIGDGGRVAVCGTRAQEVRGALAVLAADGAPEPLVEVGQVGTGLVSAYACQLVSIHPVINGPDIWKLQFV